MMNDLKFEINSLRIASPCSVGWENMTGDERTRHCDLCSLNVYNISELTTREVERLIQEREGRLCIRMYRRADGTILTRDCPVGLRAVQKRVTRFAGATLAVVLGLFSMSYSQDKHASEIKSAKVVREKIKDTNQKIELSGTTYDLNGAVIPGVPIRLRKAEDKIPHTTKTDADGAFSFKDLPKGMYELEADGVFGFEGFSYKNLEISGSEKMKITLSIPAGEVMGDFFVVESAIEMKPISVSMEIMPRKLEKSN